MERVVRKDDMKVVRYRKNNSIKIFIFDLVPI